MMPNRRVTSRQGASALSLATLLLSVWVCAQLPGSQAIAQSQTASPQSAEQPVTSPAPSAPIAQRDREFIIRAAQGHLSEIRLSRQALRKSNNAQVKTMAIKLSSEHDRALSELAAIAQQLGVSLPTAPTSTQAGQVDKLIKFSGTGYDVAVVQLMRQSHQQAIDLFRGIGLEADSSLVKAYSVKYLPRLQRHFNALHQITALQP